MTGLALMPPAGALEIEVDYRYDTNGFFDPGTTQGLQARAALEAAAARYSRIISTQLGGVTVVDDFYDARIAFLHPGTGLSWQVSAAAGEGSDTFVTDYGMSAANEYRGDWSIAEGAWVLYAGGMGLANAALGGTGMGVNFGDTLDDPNSILNRGFNSGNTSLPVWGGSVTFDNSGGTPWHFDHTTGGAGGMVDFYSVALHEIGHALGLAGELWTDWTTHVSGDGLLFTGAETLAMYEAEHGSPVAGISLESSSDQHWRDGAYQSGIFAPGDPNYTGTVGPAGMQDLLLDPTFNFNSGPARYEITNIEAAALRDVGWTLIPEPSVALLSALAAVAGLSRRSRAAAV